MSPIHSTKQSARQIFTKAFGLNDPTAREAYLNEACGSDLDLRREIERLLAAQLDERSSPLDAVEAAFGPEQTIPPTVIADVIAGHQHPQIGPYKLLESIGEGGFGTVYMAEQTTPVRRRVALKIIKPGMDSREVIARFEAERQALAMMDHPNIARILEGGTTPDGRPYFAMELVRGIPITEYCDQVRLTNEERLKLFIDLCRAIQHAHQKGIIHRDLKPSNVMVTMHDDKAVIKVIDFGIAKALSQPLTDRTLFTGYQQLLGTPLYMSPEQTQMSGIDVDTRSDVYSLGVLLYELLTGTTPFTKESLASAGFDELRRVIREEEPPRPSTRVTTLEAKARSTMADQRGIDQRKITEQLRGELDWIVMKALEKDRNRRYESPSALAADVERYLKNDPVLACPPSVLYRLGKTFRRHRVAISVASLVGVLLAIGVVGTAWQAYEANYARGKASKSLQNEQVARIEAERQRQLAEQALLKALETVDRVVTRFTDPQLPLSPGTDQLRRDLLQEALVFYREFLEQKVDAPELRFEAAKAWERVAGIHTNLNQHEACFAACRQGIELTEQLLNEFPDNREYAFHLALVCAQYGGHAVWRAFEYEQAESQLERAMGLCEHLLESDPGDEHVASLYDGSRLNMAVVYRCTGRMLQSESLFSETIESLEQLLSDDRLSAEGKCTLVSCWTQFAVQLSDRDPEAAESLFNSAISLAESNLEADPSYSRREHLAETLRTRGQFLKNRGRLVEAETDCRRGLDLMKPVVKVSFDRFHTREYFQRLRILLAKILIDDMRPNEARAIALQLLDVIPDPRAAWLAVAREYDSLGQADWAAEARALATNSSSAEE